MASRDQVDQELDLRGVVDLLRLKPNARSCQLVLLLSLLLVLSGMENLTLNAILSVVI